MVDLLDEGAGDLEVEVEHAALEAAVTGIKREFGEAWFKSPAAGDFLRELWSHGMEFDVWEIAQKLGYDGLDVGLIQHELTA